MTIVGVASGGGYLEQGTDGRVRFINPILGDAAPLVCGTGPNELDCSSVQLLAIPPEKLATLSPAQAAEISYASLDATTALYSASVGPLGDAALSSLSAFGLAKVSPTLAAVAYSPQTASTPIYQTIASNPGLYEKIQAELSSGTAALEAAGVRTDYNPDPGSPSSINMYQRYLMAIDTAAPLQPLVQAQLEKDVGLLDSIFGSPSYTPVFDPGSYYPSAATQAGVVTALNPNVFDYPTAPSAGSPPIGTTSGGILDTLGNVLQSAIPYIPNILTTLANTGVIGGSIGDAFRTNAQPMSVGGLAPNALAYTGDPCAQYTSPIDYTFCKLSQAGQVLTGQGPMPLPDYAQGATMQPVSPAQLALNSGLCGPRGPVVVNMLSAPGLFRLGCGGYRNVGKVICEKPNGQRDLYVRVGQIASPSPRVLKKFAKRWAKQAGLHCNERSSGGRRRYRRPR